jgi:hypothetical protein
MSAAVAYVYALGRVEPRIPHLSVEKEFAQATGRAQTVGLTDPAGARHRAFRKTKSLFSAADLLGINY